MDKNLLLYGNTEENELLNNARFRTTSSDSDDFGLTIDLDPPHYNKVEEFDLDNSNIETGHGDDQLCVGFEENETSVNFFVKVEKAPKTIKKSLNPKETAKQSKSEHEPFGKQKQSSSPVKDKNEKNTISTLKFPKKIKKECHKCGFEADLIKDLHEHVRNIHKLECLSCSDCPFKTTDIRKLSKHTELHSLETNATYRCSVCTFGSNSLMGHNLHMQIHLENEKKLKKEIFQCPLCPYAKSYLATLFHFRSHAREHPDLEKVLICPVCSKTTKSTSFGRHSKHHITLKSNEEIKWRNRYGKLLPQKRDIKNRDIMDKVGNNCIEKEVNKGTEKTV